ncbi:MAG: tetratricopeptide repeat protein [Spirochaetaceae bacterium]|nr:tetratricopeptide repeat protein [Spirochaetaceae bacterium]
MKKSRVRSFLGLILLLSCAPLQVFSQENSRDSIPAQFLLGQSLQNQGEFYKAIEIYQGILQDNSNYGDVWLKLAECSYELEEYALCLSYAETARIYLRNNPSLLNLIAFAHIGLGKISEARNFFLEVLKDFPNDIEAGLGLAQIEIFEGKFSLAEQQYESLLKKDGKNKKILLSLALLSYDQGKTNSADFYIEQAIKNHSDKADVYYFAAFLALKKNDLSEAEKMARSALILQPDYDKALQILSQILYKNKRYGEVIEICDVRISNNRKNSLAWFLKGIALQQLELYEDALQAFTFGLEANPNDEIMRMALENILQEKTTIADKRRHSWALYHADKAKLFYERYMASHAFYEYVRSLRLNPLNNDVRLAYANLHLNEKNTESYVNQLQFIVSRGNASREVKESLENYSALLRNSLQKKWNINPLYLQKNRFSLGFFSLDSYTIEHPDSVMIFNTMLEQYLSTKTYFSLYKNNSFIKDFSHAFALARQHNLDYFMVYSLDENSEDASVTVDLYSGKSGKKLESFSLLKSGNDKFVFLLEAMTEKILSLFPIHGKILARRGLTVLVDLGSKDFVKKSDSFHVIAQNSLYPAKDTISLEYFQDDVLGKISLTSVNEEISQGTLTITGIVDKVKVGDDIVLLSSTSNEEDSALETLPKKTTLLKLIQEIH